MFTLNRSPEVIADEFDDGRLVEYVTISSLPHLLRVSWAVVATLALHYACNAICAALGLSIFEATAAFDLRQDTGAASLTDLAIVLLAPFGHISRLHFGIEMLLLSFLVAHSANVLGQASTFLLSFLTPYFSLLILAPFAATQAAVGTASSSAALLTVAIIASWRGVFPLGWAQQLIALGLLLGYAALGAQGVLIAIMCGVALGVLASYLSNVAQHGSPDAPDAPLLAITCYYVPSRIVKLTIPVFLLLLVGAIAVGRN